MTTEMNTKMRRPASHYRRISRLGVAARKASRKPLDLKAFILSRILVNPDGCWIWQRYIHPSGYGYTSIKGMGMVSAPRLAFKTFCGELGESHVLHKCDVRACCNPDHLFLGGHRDNNLDRDRKGRQAIAERIHTTKLDKSQVSEIRRLFSLGKSKKALGRQFSVSAKNIEAIVNRQTWKHLK